MDKLRICKVANVELPAGTPITFQGNKVGQSMGGNEIAINSDIVYSWIKEGKAKLFSLEVVRK